MPSASSLSVIGDPPPDIVTAADLFRKYWRIYLAYKAIENPFNELKKFFRNNASGRTMLFPTSDNLFEVEVAQKRDTICRKVADEILAEALRLSADQVFNLHTLHPSARDEGSFELNARKLLPKRRSEKLVNLYREPATPTVRLLTR